MKFLLATLLLAALALPTLADSYPLGIGVYGGYDVPVIQQDIGSGAMWSVGVRGNVVGCLHAQLLVRGTSQGDVKEDLKSDGVVIESGIPLKGGTLTGFGLNVLLAAKEPKSVWPYAMVGLSSNSLKFGDSWKKKQSLLGWNVGGGLGFNLYQKLIYLDVNTSLLVMMFHDNKATRKNWQTLAGLQYFIPIKTK